MNKILTYSPTNGMEIAVIGMVGRFPGASDISRFWQNLKDGVEATTMFSKEELLMAGINPSVLEHPQYVRSGTILENIDLFDARFFDYSPREVEVMDPQQRIFLECAWEALEDAGYVSDNFKGEIGVYAGVNMNTYFFNLISALDITESMDNLHILTGNDKDYLTTRLSYKLNLKGPSIDVQTACSTSLVAVHLASRGLLSGDCDMALAGGISIRVPQKSGYVYHEDGIYSPDGHCRAFDAEAKGTIFGSGVGIVVLKRLEDALAARDTIHAVIKGSAINNDGSAKIGYTAPGVTGQARVIRAALLSAEVEPETVSYVETHGTATPLGDPIEIMALAEAFRSQKKGFCAIGSVKTNIGHLDTAAGVAGLIKTIQSLKKKYIPASLHFERPNPKIDFEATPFYVNTSLQAWKTDGLSRRAGVSSFGVGGTNAHVILEEAPPLSIEGPSRDWQLLVLSAKTPTALERATTHLATYLQQEDEVNLADVAYTLQVGRKAFPYRRVLKCQNREQAIEMLRSPEHPEIFNSLQEDNERSVVFLFPGQGSQYSGMAQELYLAEEEFRYHVDRCCQLLMQPLGLDLRSLLFPLSDEGETAADTLNRTEFAQPALFVIEYALAQLWLSWGLKPSAFLGHSIGEYVAACLAGVFSLEEALSLVAMRGKLIQQLPAGQMLGIALTESDLQKILPVGLDIASINGPAWCVVAGPIENIQSFYAQLSVDGIECRILRTSHAFHSTMMEPVLPLFMECVRRVNLKAPQLPFISNLTGSWASASTVTDPSYWVRHLRQTVKFAEGLKTLLTHSSPLFLEVGPGHTLSTFVRQQVQKMETAHAWVISSLPPSRRQGSDSSLLVAGLGQLWLAGAGIDWAGFSKKEQRRRIPLPTYPFERQRFWIETPTDLATPRVNSENSPSASSSSLKRETHFSLPSWKRSLPFLFTKEGFADSPWLIFKDCTGFSDLLMNELKEAGQATKNIEVQVGASFKKNSSWSYQINPQEQEDYLSLLQALKEEGKLPAKIIHLWCLTGKITHDRAEQKKIEYTGFYSLLFLAQALGRLNVHSAVEIEVVADHLQPVVGVEELQPEKALMLGPCKVIPQETPNIYCRAIDITLSSQDTKSRKSLLRQLLTEFLHRSDDRIIAYRGRDRWVQEIVEINLGPTTLPNPRLRHKGVYLLTGGLGGVGLVLAEYLARTQQARLVLLSRRVLPPKEEWPARLTQESNLALKETLLTLQHLERLGAEILLIHADVTDYQAIEQAVKRVLERFGDLHGVIHAAGIPGQGLLQFTTPAHAAEVLGAKVAGTRNLERALTGIPLDFFALCSSTIALTGAIGQVDYSAANNFLDVFAYYNTYENDVFTISINWDGWEQVGMNKQESQLHASLLDRCLEKTGTRAVYVTEFSPRKHWVLSEHKVLGKPALPGTAYLQMVKEAFQDCFVAQAIDMTDVLFLNPLWVAPDEVKEVYTVLEKEGDGFRFRILSREASLTHSPQLQEHARGKVSIAPQEAYRRLNLQEIIGSGRVKEVSLQGEVGEGSGFLVEWGPRWKSVQNVYVGENEALACIELPAAFGFDLESMDLHPTLLDLATGFASIASGLNAYLPFMYKHIRVLKPLPVKIFSYAKRKENPLAGKETVVFDITIVGETGDELVTIEDFTLVNEEALQLKASAMPERRTSVRDDLLIELLARRDSQALSTTKAVEAFEQILSQVTVPQIVVSTSDIHNRRDYHHSEMPVWKQEPDASLQPQVHHLRPHLSTTYIAPRNAQEEEIAGIWQEALGIEQIGIHDNFFDLGGHSLLAMQIVDRLRKTFDQALPLGELVKAPTIAQVSEAISVMVSEKEEQEKTELLNLLATLSDEEVEMELKKRGML